MKHGPHKHTCGSPGGPRWVGDPVDVITGENVYSKVDFTFPGGVAFELRRNYNHTWAGEARGFGRGFRHSLDQWLAFDVDGLTYLDAEGNEICFPFLERDGQRATSGGFCLLRERADEYRVSRHAQPTRVFQRTGDGRYWRLAALEKDGETLRLDYEEGRLKATWIDPRRQVTFGYDAAGQIVEAVLRAPDRKPLQLMRYRYDEHQRLVGGSDIYKQAFEQRYDVLHRLVQRIDTAGYSFFFEYDRSNRCIATHGEDGLLSVQLQYNPAARETTLIDANGAEWLYEYDAQKNLLSIVDPYGDRTVFERGPGAELIAEVDAEGRRTVYVTDAAGAQIAKRLPDGTVVPLPEGRDPPPVDEHRVPSMAIEWEYGDLFEVDFGLPDRFELGELPHSIRALLTTSESPLRGRVERVHNEAGLLTRERLEDGRKRRFGYTHRGKVRHYRDFDGSDYKLETRSWDLPWRIIDPLGHVTELDYTNSAELQQAIDPSGGRVHYDYDLKDRIVAIERNGVLHDRYEYEGSDNLCAKYDGKNRLLLEREYDGKNRLVRRTLASGDTHDFEYDENGCVTRAKTHMHDTRFAWDFARRRIRDERDGKGVRHRFAGEHLVETTVFDRFRTEYHHIDGALVVVDPSGATHRIRRHGRGVFTRDLANGWSETAQYHPRGWCLAKITYPTGAPERAQVRTYHYSGEGDLERVFDSDAGLTQHQHDAAHRLVGTTHPNGATDTYRYTKSSSLLEKPGLREATVGDLNQLRYADRHRFEYGTRQHVSAHTTPDGHRLDFRYDSRDQLHLIFLDGQPFWSAEHDAIGRRIEKNVRGQITRTYWDGDRVVAEILPDGRVRVYVYPDAFSMVPLLFVDYESEDADPKSGKRYYPFCDQRGCPERILDDLGVVVWEAHIEPYGAAHITVGADFYQPLRFPGHWYDAELGLHYNRFRYYSPWLGRYIQVDPIGEGGGWNIYAYSARPLSRVDVRGLSDECGDTRAHRSEQPDDQQHPGQTHIGPETTPSRRPTVRERHAETRDRQGRRYNDLSSAERQARRQAHQQYQEGLPVINGRRARSPSVYDMNWDPATRQYHLPEDSDAGRAARTFGQDRVQYDDDGNPDLSPFNHDQLGDEAVTYDGFSSDRDDNMRGFRDATRERRDDPDWPAPPRNSQGTAPDGWTWHEDRNPPGQAWLVPTDIHEAVPHTGGVSMMQGQ